MPFLHYVLPIAVWVNQSNNPLFEKDKIAQALVTAAETEDPQTAKKNISQFCEEFDYALSEFIKFNSHYTTNILAGQNSKKTKGNKKKKPAAYAEILQNILHLKDLSSIKHHINETIISVRGENKSLILFLKKFLVLDEFYKLIQLKLELTNPQDSTEISMLLSIIQKLKEKMDKGNILLIRDSEQNLPETELKSILEDKLQVNIFHDKVLTFLKNFETELVASIGTLKKPLFSNLNNIHSLLITDRFLHKEVTEFFHQMRDLPNAICVWVTHNESKKILDETLLTEMFDSLESIRKFTLPQNPDKKLPPDISQKINKMIAKFNKSFKNIIANFPVLNFEARIIHAKQLSNETLKQFNSLTRQGLRPPESKTESHRPELIIISPDIKKEQLPKTELFDVIIPEKNRELEIKLILLEKLLGEYLLQNVANISNNLVQFEQAHLKNILPKLDMIISMVKTELKTFDESLSDKKYALKNNLSLTKIRETITQLETQSILTELNLADPNNISSMIAIDKNIADLKNRINLVVKDLKQFKGKYPEILTLGDELVKKYNKNETALKDLETKLNELTTAFTNFKSNDYPDLIPPRVRPIGDQLQQAQLKFDKAKTLFADCRTIENSNNFNSISTTFNDIEDLFGKLNLEIQNISRLIDDEKRIRANSELNYSPKLFSSVPPAATSTVTERKSNEFTFS